LSLKESLIPFFGESEKALMFFNANYEKGVYSEPINSDTQPESILNKRIFEMMMAKNYTVKEPKMDNNDIHYQFVDFIVRTALLHREFDRPTTALPTAQKMKESFDQAVDATLKTTLTQIANFDSKPFPGILPVFDLITNPFPTMSGVVNAATPVTYANLLEKPPGSNPMQKSYYDFLCAAVFSLSYELAKLAPNTKIDATLLRTHIREQIVDLTGNCGDFALPAPAVVRTGPRLPLFKPNEGQNESPFSNLCYMTYWNKKSDPTNSAVTNLAKLLDRVEQQLINAGVDQSQARTGMDEIYVQFLADMGSLFEDELLDFALGMYQQCQLYTVRNVHELWNVVPGRPLAVGPLATPKTVDDIRDIFQKYVLENQQLKDTFVNSLKNRTSAALQRAVNSAGVPAYRAITDSDPYATHFCTHVLQNWKDLDREAREFYRKQIGVFQRYGLSASTAPTSTAMRFAAVARAAAAPGVPIPAVPAVPAGRAGMGKPALAAAAAQAAQAAFNARRTAAATPAVAALPATRPLRDVWNNDISLLDKDREMEKIDCNKENLRINLYKAKKNGSSQNMMMFAHTLPFVPIKEVGNLWYTDNLGAKRVIQKQNLTVDVLKLIYEGVYKDVSNTPVGAKPVINITIGGETMTVHGDYESFPDEEKRWDLNLTMIVKNIIRAQTQPSSRQSVSVQELLDIDTGMKWYSDGKGLYTIEIVNGQKKKLYYSEYELREYNCDNVLALNKEKVSKEQCREIAQCILESPEKLPKCLENYQSNNYDLFKVAQSELQKMDPMVAEKLLKVFHVGIKKSPIIDKNGNSTEIIRPMSFTEWSSRVLNGKDDPKGWTPEFKRALQNSEALLNYIKGIIEFVRSNPAILNHETMMTGNMDEEVEDNQLKMLGASGYNIGTYEYPYSDSVDELKYNAGFLVQSATAFAPVPTAFGLPFANNGFVGDGGMSMYGLGSMGGGAIPEGELFSAHNMIDLGSILIKLIVDLKRSGLSFKPEQEKEIEKFIVELGENEKKLKKMIQVLTTLRNLQNFVRCYDNGRYSGLTSGKVLALEEIVSHKDLLAWLNSNIGDYENCIYKGMEYINSGSQQVLKAYNDLIQASSVSDNKRRQ
jgi:hypothetical protein